MDESILVHVVEAHNGLDKEKGGLILIERLHLPDPIEQVALRCILQQKVKEFAVLKASVESQDIWVFEFSVNGYLSPENVQDLVVLDFV